MSEVRNYDKYADLGYTGLNRQGNYVYEEFLTQLRWPQAAKVYKEMADNDPTIGAILYMATQLVRKVNWDVEPASDSPQDQEAAEFLYSCMHDMETSWKDTIDEVLSMFIYGWSFHEIVYKVRKGPQKAQPKYHSMHKDGRIGWRKLPIRSQQTLYGWVFDDETGDVIAFEQQAAPTYEIVHIPMSKGLLFRTQRQVNNPEGRSLLRNAYRPWYFKKRIEEIEGIGIERDLAGLPVITPPEGVDIWDRSNTEYSHYKSQAEQIVRNVRRDRSEGLVLPHGWDFKLLSTGGTRQFDTNAIINRYDQRIAITMLADIVMLGADKVGSFALANVKKSLLAASLEAMLQGIADTLNKQAVRQLFELNKFDGLTGLPKITCGHIEMPDLNELGNYFKATGLTLNGDMELENYVRQAASMPLLTQEQFEAMQASKETASPKETDLSDDSAKDTAQAVSGDSSEEGEPNDE